MPTSGSSTRNWAISAIVLSCLYIVVSLANIAASYLGAGKSQIGLFELIPIVLACIGVVVAILAISGAAAVLRGLESGRDLLSLGAAAAALVTIVSVVYFAFSQQSPPIGLLHLGHVFVSGVSDPGGATTGQFSLYGHGLSTFVMIGAAVLQLLYCLSLYKNMALS